MRYRTLEIPCFRTLAAAIACVRGAPAVAEATQTRGRSADTPGRIAAERSMAHLYFILKNTEQPSRILVWDTRTLSIGPS
jgi:hypothetical protein